jgi:hypothetical protein
MTGDQLRRITTGTLALAVAVAAHPGYAARPMITDDARVVDPQACQLETWQRRNQGSTERWALPACNPTGNLELTFGGARTTEAGETHTTDTVLQAKTVFRKLDPDGWGVGLAVGRLHRPREEANRDFASDLYGYVPVSVSYAGGAAVLHTNVGVARPTDRSAHRITWGVGAEVQLHSQVYLIPEVFSQVAGRPFFQGGVRVWLIPNRLQVDATYGDRVGASEGSRWFSLGLRIITAPFLR